MAKRKQEPRPRPFSVEFGGKTYEAEVTPASGGMIRVAIFGHGSKVAKNGQGIERLLALELLEEAQRRGTIK